MAKMLGTDGFTVEVRLLTLEHRAVVTKRELRNGNMAVPSGTRCTVDGVSRVGFRITAPPCAHCGVRIYISKVHRDDLLLVPEGE